MTNPAKADRLLRREVSAEDEGRRLDQALAEWLDDTRARTQARIAEGDVLIDDRLAVKSHTLRVGEVVEVAHPAPTQEPVGAMPQVPIRYEDEHLLVIAKPAGLVVHAGAGRRGHRQLTLVDVLRAQDIPLSEAGDDPVRPGIVHRLDRGTSGVLAVAKTDAAYAGLRDLFSSHDVEREYWALVDGEPDPAHATIDAPIARSDSHRTRFSVTPDGRAAVSHYDLRESFGRAAVLSVRLETGRTHQVRVHLSAIGHPVSGDRLYGASPVLAEALGLMRPALHAQRLAFVHPVTGQRVEVTESLPDDLSAALERLQEDQQRT